MAALASTETLLDSDDNAPPDSALRSAIRFALRQNEIGDESPYKLSFAGKGNSGASFGFMQGDLEAGQAVATKAFRAALAQANVPPEEIESLLRRLSSHLIDNPLSADETVRINAALASPGGRKLVDSMDEEIFSGVCADLDRCVAAAQGAGHPMAAKAQIYSALWVNMSGPPTTLLTWLRGNMVRMARVVPAPDGSVDGNAMETYLRATPYFAENPGNFPHIQQSASAGMNQLSKAVS